MTVTLDIVIVNWNSGTQLRDCLNSIKDTMKNTFVLSRVVVVDNGSTDGSIHNLECSDLPLTVIHNSINLGFAKGCNQGADKSSSQYLLFLNPDTRLFNDSLDVPIVFMERRINKNVGICGIQLVDENNILSRSCSRFPTIGHVFNKAIGLMRVSPRLFPGQDMSEWNHNTDRKVDQVIGAFFLVREKLFCELNGFDERFFVYFEEVDFSYRAFKAGWRSYYLANCRAYHKGGGSSEQVKAKRLFYSLRSRILYGYKHFSLIGGTFILLTTVLLELVTRATVAILRGSLSELGEILQAYYLLYLSFPSELRKKSKSDVV